MSLYKFLKYTLFFWIVSISSYSQTNYIINDTLLYTGINLIDEGNTRNSMYCTEKKATGELVQYSPFQISEYGFENGRVFHSKVINENSTPQKYFLELLVKGSFNLYCYYGSSHTKYFIEKSDDHQTKNATLDELDAKNYKNKLFEIAKEINTKKSIIETVSFNKNSIVEFIKRLNRGKIYELASSRWGVSLLVESSKFEIPNQIALTGIENMEYQRMTSFSIGIFKEIPISFGPFSLKLESYISSHYFLFNSTGIRVDRKSSEYNFRGNYTSLKLPIQLKYFFTKKAYSSFISLGPISSFNFISKSTLYEAVRSGTDIKILKPIDLNVIRLWQFGYTISCGFGHLLFGSFKPSVELKFIKLFGTYPGGDHLNNSEICLVSGIAF